jgi:hypothetical protein
VGIEDRPAFSFVWQLPYGIKEQVQSVAEVLPNLADRDWVFWKTSNRVFRLGLSDTGFMTPAALPVAA